MNQNALRFLKYLDFKIKCALYQQENPVRLDMDRVLRNIEELGAAQEQKIPELAKAMPKVKKTKWQNKPKATHKKDGTLSVAGENWVKALKENGLSVVSPKPGADPLPHRVQVFSHWEEPNPNSPEQVKAWLYSLGWVPCTFDYKRNKETGEERQIEQVRKDGELAPSVEILKDKDPAVEILEGLTVIQHRLGVFKGLRDCATQDPLNGNWYIAGTFGGLTNTLRFKHKKPLTNLPGVDKPYGEEIRACLMADDGETFVGCDMVSLESTTKRHFIYPIDPEYAEEMNYEGYDEHIDLAIRDGQMTKEEAEFYKWYKSEDD